LSPGSDNSTLQENIRKEISRLGGSKQAAHKLRNYLAVPRGLTDWGYPQDRYTAIYMLGACKADGSRALIEILDRRNYDFTYAVKAMGYTEDASCVPRLIELSASNHWSVRYEVAQALGRLGGPEAVATLYRMKKDTFIHVRKAAAEALEKIRKAKDDKQRTGIAWGIPVKGLQAGLSQDVDSSGKTVIGYHVRNTGSSKLRILKLEAARRHVNTLLEAHVNGILRKCVGPQIDPAFVARESDFINLSPGHSDTLRRQLDLGSWELKGAKVVELTFVLSSPVGVLRSGSIEVDVK
jgi:hypothetical protein